MRVQGLDFIGFRITGQALVFRVVEHEVQAYRL